jgi:hypothetical protein
VDGFVCFRKDADDQRGICADEASVGPDEGEGEGEGEGEPGEGEGEGEGEAPVSWTCPDGYFDTQDGCDCGCGANDPDCSGDGCSGVGCRASGCEYCYDTSVAATGGQASAGGPGADACVVCTKTAFTNANGNGLEATDGAIEPDSDNTVSCDPASAAQVISFVLDDSSINDLDADDVKISADGGLPFVCAGSAAVNGFVACIVCLEPVPASIAVQYDDGTDRSNALCVGPGE